MGILSIFKPLKVQKVNKWKELGAYQSTFSSFGVDAFRSDTVRSCIRPLADYSSKAKAVCEDKQIEKILNDRPNMYMSGHDFLYKVRTKLELNNNCFIYIQRDNRGRAIGFYPVPYSWFEAVEYANGLFIKFYFSSDAVSDLCLSWKDIAVVRKDYNKSDIAGDNNNAIIEMLELMNTTNEGLANSIKSTANLRGILKSTKAMLASDDIKKQRDQFVKDYLSLENNGGIASLDSTQEFTPITMNPMTASYDQMKEIRENIYRYFGVNDDVVMGRIVKSEELENFYRMRIEPFLVALSRELTSKVFANSDKKITYMAEQGEFMTVTQKLEMFNKVVLYSGMTINEWRRMMGYGDIEGGDKPIRRLDSDYITSDEQPREGNDSEKSKEENEDDNSSN